MLDKFPCCPHIPREIVRYPDKYSLCIQTIYIHPWSVCLFVHQSEDSPADR